MLGESNVGVIFTDGDPLSNDDSSTYGTDFNYRNTRLPGNKVLEANAWMQETDNPSSPGESSAYGFGISSPNNTGWNGCVSARQIEENFDPAAGFVNERGIRNSSGDLGYRWRFDGSRMVRTIEITSNVSRTERLDTGLLDRQDARMRVSVTTRNQDRFNLNFFSNKENIPLDFPIYQPSTVLDVSVKFSYTFRY